MARHVFGSNIPPTCPTTSHCDVDKVYTIVKTNYLLHYEKVTIHLKNQVPSNLRNPPGYLFLGSIGKMQVFTPEEKMQSIVVSLIELNPYRSVSLHSDPRIALTGMPIRVSDLIEALDEANVNEVFIFMYGQKEDIEHIEHELLPFVATPLLEELHTGFFYHPGHHVEENPLVLWSLKHMGRSYRKSGLSFHIRHFPILGFLGAGYGNLSIIFPKYSNTGFPDGLDEIVVYSQIKHYAATTAQQSILHSRVPSAYHIYHRKWKPTIQQISDTASNADWGFMGTRIEFVWKKANGNEVIKFMEEISWDSLWNSIFQAGPSSHPLPLFITRNQYVDQLSFLVAYVEHQSLFNSRYSDPLNHLLKAKILDILSAAGILIKSDFAKLYGRIYTWAPNMSLDEFENPANKQVRGVSQTAINIRHKFLESLHIWRSGNGFADWVPQLPLEDPMIAYVEAQDELFEDSDSSLSSDVSVSSNDPYAAFKGEAGLRVWKTRAGKYLAKVRTGQPWKARTQLKDLFDIADATFPNGGWSHALLTYPCKGCTCLRCFPESTMSII